MISASNESERGTDVSGQSFKTSDAAQPLILQQQFSILPNGKENEKLQFKTWRK